MKEKIVFINFWSKGGMRHYSDAIVNILSKKNDVIYLSNYKSDIGSNNKIVNLSLNPIKIYNYIDLIYIIYFLFKIKPKVVHLNSGYPVLILIYPIFYFFNSVITVHDAISHNGESLIKIFFHKIQLFMFSLFFKKIIVHSNKINSELPFYVNRNKVFIVPHVNYNHLATGHNDEKNKQINKRFAVLFFGRILEYKGLKYLIEAFDFLDEDKYELIIAGEGDIDFKILNKNIKVINKFIPDSDIPFLFNSADVVVIPYTEASQSGVAYLSFAYIKPIIATSVGSLGDIVIDGENGYVVKPRSSKDICLAIQRINNPLIYNKFINNIKEKTLSSDLEIVNKLINIYK